MAEFAGCSTKTVSREAARLFPHKSRGRGVTKIFTADEASMVYDSLPKRDIIDMAPVDQEHRVGRPTEGPVQPTSSGDAAMVFVMQSLIDQVSKQNETMLQMQTQQQEFMERVIDRLQPKEVQGPPEQLQLPNVPPKSIRASINQIVRQYANRTGCAHSSAWNSLFSEMLYRGRVNLTTKAKNMGMARMDYAQEHGYLPTLLAIAGEIFAA